MRQKLQSKQILWGASLTRVAAPSIVELYGMLGVDFVWIDMEHSDFDFHDLSALTLAARAAGTSAAPRISQNDPKLILKSLECGADGLIVPDVRNADEARRIVSAAKFFPEGARGMAGSDVKCLYGLKDLPSYINDTNRETALIVQIEHEDAVREADSIAAVPGIDGIFVGKMDLSQSFGVPGQIAHPKVVAAVAQVASACRCHGKTLGLGVGSVEDARKSIELGARFLVIASEMGLLRARLKEMLASYRELSAACLSGETSP